MENPNAMTHVAAAAGMVTFQYHDWFARLSAVNAHLWRLQVSRTQDWPTTPDIPVDPKLANQHDATVATGGRGQHYAAPIITATDQAAVTRTGNQVSCGPTTITLATDRLTLPNVTLRLPQLTATGWTMRVTSPDSPAYFGGGTQNGRVSLNGLLVQIANENRWTQDGVSSPVPFYWSTAGYGLLANTFTPGEYDFSNPASGVMLSHAGENVDVYLLLGDTPASLLHGYHELTGLPNLNPTFSYYPAHFNAYNRDYWVPVTPASAGAIRFEDGRWYKEYQPLNPQTFNLGYRPGAITVAGQSLVPNVYGNGNVTFTEPDAAGMPRRALQETLNGEHDRQFSARAVIDRYAKAGLPLGWLIPNDGYGAGYGQTGTFAGDLANLSSFADYARSRGVTTGLWTQAALAPKDAQAPRAGERDLAAELDQAGVRALKTDVAWVGEGYTFGLNATTAAGTAMRQRNLRPMIVTVDGWAGTQRDATVWSGDQAGSDWQNLAMHIGTYLSTGLSGNPNVASDVDGIYGGDDPVIQTRDLQWKAFTPYLFAMDGWGSQPKTMGLAAGDPYLSINRAFLQYHTMLLPYFETLAWTARTTGAPILRPTFWEFPSSYAYRHLNDQLLLGSALLLAPIQSDYGLTASGAGRRAHLYLPAGEWRDFWTGEPMGSDRTLSDVPAPLGQFPIYVRAGSLIPLTPASQNPAARQAVRLLDYYPGPASTLTVTASDGESLAYTTGAISQTHITAASTPRTITLTIAATTGHYAGEPAAQPTTLFVALATAPTAVSVTANDEQLPVTTAFGLRENDPLARSETGVSIHIPALPTHTTTIRVAITR